MKKSVKQLERDLEKAKDKVKRAHRIWSNREAWFLEKRREFNRNLDQARDQEFKAFMALDVAKGGAK